MSEWIVRYLDTTTNREVQSRPMRTREQAVALASRREREGCFVRDILGPSGGEPWKVEKVTRNE